MRRSCPPAKTLRLSVSFLSLLFLGCSVIRVHAVEKPLGFNADIRPILSDKCFHCHGPDSNKREAGLRLDLGEAALAKLESGKRAVVPGKPEESELIHRIVHDDRDELMPPPESHKTLSDGEINTLTRWIKEGAVYQKHWAFEPIAKPEPPKLDPAALPEGYEPVNAIDHFIVAKLAGTGLQPSPEADRHTLLRRVALDLTGLPPTDKQIRLFTNQALTLEQAYVAVVTDLLNSPAHGENVAWQWLDAARYADSDGYESDPLRTMWPWRDWVVNAFNENLPYDQFVIQQLAGDLLPGARMRQVVATGFNRNHRLNNEGGVDPDEWLIEYVADRAETTATVFMGLTWQCARCHDHKFDPITQKDYYQLFAFFHNVPEVGNSRGTNAPPALDVPALPYLEKYEGLLEKLVPMERQLADFRKAKEFGPARDAWQETLKSDEAAQKKLPGDLGKKAVAEWDAKLKAQAEDYFLKNVYPATAALRKQMRPLESEAAKLRGTGAKIMVMAELDKPRETHLLERGAWDQPREVVTADSPSFLPPMDPKLPKNRLGLAKWLTGPDHPLTARVIVNRTWERFFGTGLVKTQEDFGSQGDAPTHPELLDYLASWLIENGWDLRALEREIVMSATYRQRSTVSPQAQEIDPDNRLISRGPRYRLPAAVIRDQALSAAGTLVPDLGGPPVKPYQPAGLWKEIIKGRVEYKRDTGDKLYRRSLYTLWRRAVKPPLMELLDSNGRDICAVNQKRTNTPLQALLLMNDVTFVEAARGLAGRMISEGGESVSDRLTQGYLLTMARPPTEPELNVLESQLESDLAHYRENPAEASSLLMIGESKSDPKLDPVELAAYTNIARVLLNLDETVTKE
ncbi:MAG: PSD1 domain-containing protein [Verrucomicrobiae bacterium]|nr:PSD1 domain-containing protein [Verrucomicrobiae bacterium]